MAEDTREPIGHIFDFAQVRLELFRLVTTFLSSDEIDRLSGAGVFDVDYEAEHPWLASLAANFSATEVSRILITTAIQGRILSGWPGLAPYAHWKSTCGELVEATSDLEGELASAPIIGTPEPLTLREAFNKIIHAEWINPDVDADAFLLPDPPVRLNPIVHLRGTQNKKAWRASLDVLAYVRALSPMVYR